MARKAPFVIWVEFILFKAIALFVDVTPHRIALWVGKILGRICYVLMRSAREVTFINLKIAFPKKSETERKKIALSCFEDMGASCLEILKSRRKKASYFNSKTTIDGFERLEKIIDSKKTLIVCFSHFSNFVWPLLASASREWKNSHLLKMNILMRPLDNPLLTKEFYSNTQKMCFLSRRKSMKTIVDKMLKKNELLILGVDQNAAMGGIFVPFFGKMASTMKGVSFFQKKTKAEVFCCYDLRDKKGRHKVFFSKPIFFGKDDEVNLRKVNAFYEKIIEQHPEKYFWMHPRWKKRPAGEKNFYEGLHV